MNLFREKQKCSVGNIFSLHADSFDDVCTMEHNCVQTFEQKEQTDTIKCLPGTMYFIELL